MPIKVIIADDHQLFRTGIGGIIRSFGDDFSVIGEAADGQELLQLFEQGLRPDIILLDIDMPIMDGITVTPVIHEKYPRVSIIVVSMLTDEMMMIKMLRLGVSGYLSKNVDPPELKKALEVVYSSGTYYTGEQSGMIRKDFRSKHAEVELNDRERDFIELVCTDATYKEIADKMGLSVKTIDGYREALFEKLKVKSRIGLVLYAVKRRMIVVR